MIGYDFDKTILACDSTVEFYKFCLKRTPRLWINVFYQMGIGLAFKLGLMKKTTYKEKMYSFLKYVKNIDQTIEKFWDKMQGKVYKYYLRQRRDDDVIISASPEFLLKPIIDRINPNATLIASRVNKFTGKYTGLNCYGVEKLNRFHEVYGDVRLEAFSSDSMSDAPMFRQAEKQYLIKKGQIQRIDTISKIMNGFNY